MKYIREQRLDTGHRTYDGEITRYEAAEQYEHQLPDRPGAVSFNHTLLLLDPALSSIPGHCALPRREILTPRH